MACRHEDHPVCDEDHEHHHEHEHHHDHEHGTPEGIEISTHEGAVIGTVRVSIPGEYEAATALLRDRMAAEASDIEAEGGFIGHVKAFAREERQSCMISITEGGDIQRKESCMPQIHVEHAAIVFGVREERLRVILAKHFGEFLN